ncbi:glycerol-3-phosphate 1-O-acyltransferase PlsY [Agarivorans sp. B2Z047]|uniref:glycerol-3-phosphate 1-O-acyltransferase PlsY n=1 Tax=Agarivorans sp. B2Z047 TaxID=2652721 RepID=UPI00128D851A|nr:glycerol-3-phosphate 1-O-acyltransferase PlsY [Agarivorans sp. B2Z047]MPW30584.1 glycerol-3-phosphate 1-O-acyltransferase PlsY [Agarivorans sp. B2Z047]UQN42192.1 glycerol-3-phosphate 1-O-acyltransferase PlsY [Agarivorans sp. B2Z047]
MGLLGLFFITAAYLLGSISSAVLICRIYRLPDPRQHGSNNPGATNVYRIGGKIPAALVLVCDLLKGMVPVWMGYYAGLAPIVLGFVGIAACLGHMYPIFFHFEGGKGVATALGGVLPIGLDLAALLIVTWIMTLKLRGYSSLAAIVSVSLAPLYTWLIKSEYTLPVAMLACLIIIRHQGNITRLRNHTESKVVNKDQ